MLNPKPCYNKQCYKKVCVYLLELPQWGDSKKYPVDMLIPQFNTYLYLYWISSFSCSWKYSLTLHSELFRSGLQLFSILLLNLNVKQTNGELKVMKMWSKQNEWYSVHSYKFCLKFIDNSWFACDFTVKAKPENRWSQQQHSDAQKNYTAQNSNKIKRQAAGKITMLFSKMNFHNALFFIKLCVLRWLLEPCGCEWWILV